MLYETQGPQIPNKNQEMKCVVSRLQVAHHPSQEVWFKATQENFIRAYLKFSGPAINCHTCSYMNSEAKCLRGEGSCTIQNSQQCMLKKIFEGIVGTSWGDLCQQTHQPTWVFMGSSWMAGRGQACGGIKLCFPETWKFNKTLSFQNLISLLMER